MLDTIYRVETPEGISLYLRSAGLFSRAMAWLLDFAIRLGVIWALSIALALIGEVGEGILLVLMFLIWWFYGVLFEVLRDGQTIGKRVMGIRVVMQIGTPVTWLPSITRNFLRVVDFLPFFYAAGVLACWSDPYGRRMGDWVAGTLVVYSERVTRRSDVPVVPAIPIATPLKAEEQAALVNFAERAATLTRERQEELADVLQPLTARRGAAAVHRLLAHANALLGRGP